jgi:hypothetical protein
VQDGRLVERAEGEEMMSANHRERQFMQHLRGAGWVKASTLPSSPRIVAGLLAKDWIELRGAGRDACYRITEKGLAAKMVPVRM